MIAGLSPVGQRHGDDGPGLVLRLRADAREGREGLVHVAEAVDDGEGVLVPVCRDVALVAAPGLVVVDDKLLEIECLPSCAALLTVA